LAAAGVAHNYLLTVLQVVQAVVVEVFQAAVQAVVQVVQTQMLVVQD
jgi:hypothetical protein